MTNLIIGTMENGEKCVYDVPPAIHTAEEFTNLICGYNGNPARRDELQGQPKLKGYVGPMFNGYGRLKSTGEKVAIIRYEN